MYISELKKLIKPEFKITESNNAPHDCLYVYDAQSYNPVKRNKPIDSYKQYRGNISKQIANEIISKYGK